MRIFFALLVAGALATTAAAATGSPRVAAKIKVKPAAQPCAAAAGGRFVWVSEYGSRKLLKIDPRTNKIRSATPIGSGSCGLGYGAGSMWVEDTYSNTVSRVSVRTGKRTAAVPVGSTPYDAMFAYGSAWATANGGNELDRIDPATNTVVARIPVQVPVGAVAAFGSVWVGGAAGVTRVDPATNKVVATIANAAGAGWTAASADAVWVTSPGKLLRIDPATNTIAASVPLPPAPPGDPDVVGGKVWVPIIRLDRVLVIDPATNSVERTLKTGVGPFVVTAVGGDAWVPSYQGSDIWRFKAS